MKLVLSFILEFKLDLKLSLQCITFIKRLYLCIGKSLPPPPPLFVHNNTDPSGILVRDPLIPIYIILLFVK